MPHIIVKLYPGRTQEQKQLLTDKIVEAVLETINTEETSISVAVEEIPREMWKEKVYKPDIISKENTLTKKPGYTMDYYACTSLRASI
jgi:4-oxalocrotonate tautomerase